MKLQLIHGHFEAKDAIEILTHMIHVKIRFHESKITSTSSEEEIKMREKRIKQLQKDLYEARVFIEKQKGAIDMDASLNFET